MTLFTRKDSIQVFDLPPRQIKQGENLIKRFLSKASVSVFSGKNTPIQPSQEIELCKCYSESLELLFKKYGLITKVPKRFKVSIEKHFFQMKPKDVSNFLLFQIPPKILFEQKLKLFLTEDAEIFKSGLCNRFEDKNTDERIVLAKPAKKREFYSDREAKFVLTRNQNENLKLNPSHKLIGTISKPVLKETKEIFRQQSIGINSFSILDKSIKRDERTLHKIATIIPSLSQPILNKLETFKAKDFYETHLKPAYQFVQLQQISSNTLPVKPNLSNFSFEIRNEIGKNLVLEAYSILKPIEKIASQEFTYKKSEKLDQKIASNRFNSLEQIDFLSPTPFLFEEKYQILSPAKSIKTSQSQIISLSEVPVKKAKDFNSQISFFAWPTQKSERNWKKYKLSLKRESGYISRLKCNFTLPESILEPKTFNHLKALKQTSKDIFSSINFETLNQNFSQLKGFKDSIKLKKYYGCQKRVFMALRTAGHARYTKKILKTIVESTLNYFDRAKHGVQKTGFKFHPKTLHAVKSFREIYPQKFEDAISFLQPIQPFLMSITDPHFTDVVLPEKQRKAISSKILPGLSTRLKTLLKRELPLKQFVYKEPFKKQLFVSSKKAGKIKILEEMPEIPQIFTRKNYLLLNSNFVFSNIFSADCCFAHDEVNVDYELYAGSIPDSLREQIPLDFQILPGKNFDHLAQKEIVPPPDWPFLQKQFNCVLRLYPYYFGFPKLVEKKSLFNSVVPYLNFEIPPTATQKLVKEADFFFNIFKPYRSKFSLKNPKKWLWPGFQKIQETMRSLPYKKQYETPILSVSKMNKIHSFTYPWANEDPKFMEFGDFAFEFSKKSASSGKSFSICALNSFYQLDNSVFEVLKSHNKKIEMNEISKFLPTAPDLQVLSQVNQNFKVDNQRAFKIQLEVDSETIVNKSSHPLSRILKLKLLQKPAKKFRHRLSKIENEFKTLSGNFKFRSRRFSFPWVPEQPSVNVPIEVYYELDDVSVNLEHNIYSESQIILFNESEVKGISKAFCIGTHRKISKAVKNFNCQNVENLKAGFQSFQDETGISLTTDKTEKKFLPIKENLQNLPLKFAERNQIDADNFYPVINSFNGQIDPGLAPRKIAFLTTKSSELMNGALDSFELTPVHWVILLDNFLKISQKFSLQKIHNKFIKSTTEAFDNNLKGLKPTAQYLERQTLKLAEINQLEAPKFFASAKIQEDLNEQNYSSFEISTNCKAPDVLELDYLSNLAKVKYNLKGKETSLQISSLPRKTGFSENQLSFKSIATPFPEIVLEKESDKSVKNFKFPKQKDCSLDFKPAYIPDWYDMNSDFVSIQSESYIKKAIILENKNP